MIDLVWRLLRLRGPVAEDEEEPPFLAGLALGALVGAAIAGSTIWRRVRRRRRGPAHASEDRPAD